MGLDKVIAIVRHGDPNKLTKEGLLGTLHSLEESFDRFNVSITGVWYGPVARAEQTGKIIATHFAVPSTLEPRLDDYWGNHTPEALHELYADAPHGHILVGHLQNIRDYLKHTFEQERIANYGGYILVKGIPEQPKLLDMHGIRFNR